MGSLGEAVKKRKDKVTRLTSTGQCPVKKYPKAKKQ